MVTGLEPRLREISHELGIAFPDGPVWTFADAEQLEEAIAALAAFAIAHTSNGSKLTWTCDTGRVTERTGTATLAPGLLRTARHPPAPGHGVVSPRGLFRVSCAEANAVTRAYLNIRQWGGDILHASDPQLGSNFTLFLPYAEAPYIEPIPAEPAAEPMVEPVVELEPEPEPIPVEPEPEPVALGTILKTSGRRTRPFADWCARFLRRENYEVLEAGSGEEALTETLAQDTPIDLLLTDVMLPGMGGRELAESLTAANPDLKVVYVSGCTCLRREHPRRPVPPGPSFCKSRSH